MRLSLVNPLGAVCLAGLLVSLASAPIVGCQSDDDGLDGKQNATKDRFQQVMERSTGDWSKLSQEDKDFLVGLSNGNEEAARTMFQMRAARSVPGTSSGGPASK